MLLACPVWVFLVRARMRSIRLWLVGERDEQIAGAAWDAAVGRLPGSAAVITGVVMAAVLPAAAYIGPYVFHVRGGLWVLMISMFIGLMVVGQSLIGYMVIEQAFRPLVRDLVPHLPPGFVDRHRGPTLSVKLQTVLPGMNVFTGMLLSAVALSAGSLGLRARVEVTIAAVTTVSLTLPLALALLFRRSLLLRLGDLREAFDRVRAGDLAAQMPYLAGDEIDDVGQSFNQMVAGLREREVLHAALGSYVAPDVARRVLTEGALLEGEEVECSVLFADIRDFTALSERLTARAAVEHLNEFFAVAVPLLTGYGAHVNKYIGDGLLAAFGIPDYLSDHADRALEAACQLIEATERAFGGAIRIGVGINSGPVIAGTVGGGTKLEYTLIGDTVNVAARVEQLTKELGEPVLITEDTKTRLKSLDDVVAARGSAVIKGKSRPVVLYAPPASHSPRISGRVEAGNGTAAPG